MIESLKKNRKGIVLMLISSFCVCIGQLFWKLSTNGNIIFLILGFLLYGIGALIMLIAYKYGSLSVLHPMLSANYIFTIFLAWIVLNETITLRKVVGILIITLGVVTLGDGE